MEMKSVILMSIALLSAVTTVCGHLCEVGNKGYEKYMRYSLDHSYCSDSCCSCTYYEEGVPDWLKKQILHEHNSLRSKIAGGKSYGVDHLPRATNMLEMVWDEELADIAQKWVNSCKREHDCDLCRMVDRFPVGQSIVEFEGSIMDLKDYQKEFDSHFNGVRYLHEDLINRYADSSEEGSLIQLLWAKTWRIGCGFLDFDGGYRDVSDLVCNYGPRGNVEGEEVYKSGKVCSDCPANSCCGDDCEKYGITASYDGLCKVIDESLSPEGNSTHEKSGKEIFHCDFNGESDCSYTVEGVDHWNKTISTGGTWIGTELGSKEYTVLKFNKPIISKSGEVCLRFVTRSGPTVANVAYNYELTGKLEKEGKYRMAVGFPDPDDKVKHLFHSDYFQSFEFPKEEGVKLTLRFEVPFRAGEQYFDIMSIVAEEKDCPKLAIRGGTWFEEK